jgi:hypothetical protein
MEKKMKTILVAFIMLLSSSVYAQEPKQKKEVLISMSSAYYKNASQVIEGFLKQAQISDFFIDERIEKIERKNFQFKNKTVDQTVNLLSQFYNIEFKFTEKKDFVTVIFKEKKL